jgi:hypothetical protein
MVELEVASVEGPVMSRVIECLFKVVAARRLIIG